MKTRYGLKFEENPRAGRWLPGHGEWRKNLEEASHWEQVRRRALERVRKPRASVRV